MDFPRTVYVVPGPISGSGFIPAPSYDARVVEDEKELKRAIEDGFSLTPMEAVEAYNSRESDEAPKRRGRPPKEAQNAP